MPRCGGKAFETLRSSAYCKRLSQTQKGYYGNNRATAKNRQEETGTLASKEVRRRLQTDSAYEITL